MGISCNGKTNNNTSNNEKENPNAEKLEIKNELSVIEHDILNFNNYDSTLVKFIYENIDNYQPESFKEEYQAFYETFDSNIILIESLYKSDIDYNLKINKVREMKNHFITYTRNKVRSDYLKYNSLIGMDFGFLISRNDSLVKPLIIELMNNDAAPLSEKEYCAKVFLKKYNDSTYIDFVKKNN